MRMYNLIQSLRRARGYLSRGEIREEERGPEEVSERERVIDRIQERLRAHYRRTRSVLDGCAYMRGVSMKMFRQTEEICYLRD